jgi:hypothetical protein
MVELVWLVHLAEPQHFTLAAAAAVFIKALEVQVLPVRVVVVTAATRQLEGRAPTHQRTPVAVVAVEQPAPLRPQVMAAVV